MSEVNIFEQAARIKLRFATARGELLVEDLWDVGLTKGAVNLNDLAKAITRQLKTTEEEGLVKVANSANKVLELKLEILKYVFESRQAAQDKATQAAATRETRQKLAELIAQKKDQDLAGKSIEELEAMLKATEEQ